MRHAAVAMLLIMGCIFPGVAYGYTVGGPSEALSEWAKQNAEEAAEAQRKENEKAQAEQASKERREAEERKAAEEPQHGVVQKTEAMAPECIVPSLKGDSLSTARRSLKRAHCRLGVVSRPRGHHRRLVVTAIGRRVGARLPGGTLIAIKLGSPAKKHA